jgi:RNA-binding protein YlmH
MISADKDEKLLRKRLMDQANTAYNKGICVFSDFLNLYEQNVYLSLKKELPAIKYFTYGGFDDAERKILCFCGDDTIDDIADIEFPISCLKVTPVNKKFSTPLGHRDFLGTILSLGLDRSRVGDILVKDNEGYVFVHNQISSYLTEQLIQIKHTNVSTSLIEHNNFDYKPALKEITGTVSSVRLDSILAVAFNSSRSSLAGLIEGGKVFVGGRLILSSSYTLKENDIVSVRGLGRFIFCGTSYQTKKGRYSIKVLLYIT